MVDSKKGSINLYISHIFPILGRLKIIGIRPMTYALIRLYRVK